MTSHKKSEKEFRNVLIVLGCQPQKNGIPSSFMKNRLKKAVKLYKRNKYSKIILSGGIVKYPLPEADIMKMALQTHIPKSKILLERNSRSTIENAVFCWELLKNKRPKKITIVTSEFHIPRTKYIFLNTYKHLNCKLRFEPAIDALLPLESFKFFVKEKIALLRLHIWGIR